ncbi:MAG TPA: AraC family transcriptional regulator, partial [Halioglobus sp.]
MRDLSISVYFARAVLKNAVAQGLDPISLLRKNRISPRLLLEDNARISIERFADLHVSTLQAMGDEALGYGGRRLPVGCWAMMCHAVIGCETLGEALNRYCRFYQMFEMSLFPALEVAGDVARVQLVAVNAEQASIPYPHELMLVNTHRFASWLVQEHLPVQVVQLSFVPLAQAQDYRQLFLGNPVEFQQPRSQLVLSRALLDKRITQNESSLRHFLRHPVLIMLTQDYAINSWTSRVRDIVYRQLRDIPELNDVATTLEVHPQTLRRR